jgi:hypothetical protein
VRLQQESIERYRVFARGCGWTVHTVTDAPIAENLARGSALLWSQITALRPSWHAPSVPTASSLTL